MIYNVYKHTVQIYVYYSLGLQAPSEKVFGVGARRVQSYRHTFLRKKF